jgi:hypothetical protein
MFVAGLAITVAGTLVGGSVVSAHNPVLAASVGCDNIVRFQVSSWTTGPEGENSDIEVYYLVNNEEPKVVVMHGAVNAANGYTFSGSFPWPGDATLVVVYAEAHGRAHHDARSHDHAGPDHHHGHDGHRDHHDGGRDHDDRGRVRGSDHHGRRSDDDCRGNDHH